MTDAGTVVLHSDEICEWGWERSASELDRIRFALPVDHCEIYLYDARDVIAMR